MACDSRSWPSLKSRAHDRLDGSGLAGFGLLVGPLLKLSPELAKTKPGIFVESLAIKEMARNRSVSRRILDAGWARFLAMLRYKTLWSGSPLGEAPRFYPSTKKCSACGSVKESMLLSERVFPCDWMKVGPGLHERPEHEI